MREILFRGKSVNSGEWVEGYYCPCVINGFPADDCIISKERLDIGCWTPDRIIPESIGQFTGLYDVNGKKIFEGDIVVTRYPKGDICSIGDVQFDSGVFGAEWTLVKKNKGMVGSWGQPHNLRRFDDNIINHIEVIGNIHDNPELVK